MKRGRRAELPSVKDARGTSRPDRDGGLVEVIDHTGLPSKPDWLTAAGEEVWIDEVGRVAVGKFVSERDTTMFANYCNLQGAINQAWKAGEVPPAAHLMEARKMAEQFGLFGAKSRIGTKGNGEPPSGNPFTANGRRPA